ncbi:MAG TPA: D-glycero-beta-D-manno-heptose 1-phosphate adenylyltransferase [Nitrospiria bacterium]|nr:D-glycero-beta-D-manno-heptose 1-phosphate adenylyltransferase [Nitrospiria bacterium]
MTAAKPARRKIVTPRALQTEVRAAHRRHRRVVFTNGCFDLIHVGHVRYLERAKRLGDLLVVAVNTDRSVRRLKGPHRPIVPQAQRAEVVAALGCVDYVVLFSTPTPRPLIAAVRPDILVKGADWAVDQIEGKAEVETAGGRVRTIPLTKGSSTTKLIKKIRALGRRADEWRKGGLEKHNRIREENAD